jgi:hypothetical protein
VPSLTVENESFVNRLGSLSKLMIHASETVEKHADDIVDKCIKDILLQCHEPGEGGEDWIEDADLGPECRAKVTKQTLHLTTDSCFENPCKPTAK